MLPNCPHTAILLFVRSADQEARVKPLLPSGGYRGNRQLARLLNKQAQQVAERTGLPLFVVSGERQEGASFGERLHHALQSIFQRGFSKLIAIGNDCLELSSKDIARAATMLQAWDLVVGPSADGGAYLIGIDQQLFQQAGFQVLPWESKSLFTALLAWAKRQNARCHFLPAREDADTAGTLLRLARLLAFSPFKLQLLQLLGLFQSLQSVYIHSYESFLMISSPRRGPPPAFSS